MTSIKESAKAFVPKQTRNITELEVVNIETLQVEKRSGKDKDGKDFNYNVVISNEEEFRIPDSVLNNIKTILQAKPNLKTIRVLKKGQGLGTEYTVVPLD